MDGKTFFERLSCIAPIILFFLFFFGFWVTLGTKTFWSAIGIIIALLAIVFGISCLFIQSKERRLKRNAGRRS